MKTILETEDIEKIAKQILDRLKPLLKNNGKGEGKDVVFDVESLSQYLKVDKSWIYKQVQLNTLPYFKCGKYTRFKKSQVDNWIEKETVMPVSSLSLIKSSR